MANKNIFGTTRTSTKVPHTDTTNEAGGVAYELKATHALAQVAATGTFNDTFYTSGEDQLDKVLELAQKVSPRFLAQVAIFARERGFMKDMPALLCAVLSTKDIELLKAIFPQVIDNGKMLRNFVQIMRSGKIGRKSLGSAPKNLIKQWLEDATDKQILEASVGNDPSLADVVKMVHPHPKNNARNAFYGWLLGREYNHRQLPENVRAFEDYKSGKSKMVPDVPFQMLTALELGTKGWTEIARNAKWHMTRMNLNTFQRHGVFDDKEMVQMIADRLRDEKQIRNSKVFPYQLLVAYLNATDTPKAIQNALQDAMEIAVDNVPSFDGQVYVFPDVSGSMSSPITGHRAGSTSKVRCIDVAALIAAAVLRNNKDAEVIPFEGQVCDVTLNSRDSVMTNAEKLASIGGGSTNCSAPLALLNQRKAKGDLLIYVSDNESWADHWINGSSLNVWGSNRRQGTVTQNEWTEFKKRNPKAKMVCIDLCANTSTQAKESKDILNLGGFSDAVFNQVRDFVGGEWIGLVRSKELASRRQCGIGNS